MNIGIVIRHPEHARFFGEPIAQLRDRGHAVTLLVRECRHATDLLDESGLEYRVLVGEADGVGDLLVGHAAYELGVLREARRRDVDVLASVGGRAITHLAPLLGVPSVVFADWDPGSTDRVVARLADVVATPSFLRDEYGPNQVVYDGLQELAYLHPERYEPAPHRASGGGSVPVTDGGDADDPPSGDADGSAPADTDGPAPGDVDGLNRHGPTVVVGFTPERAETVQTTETLTALDGSGDVVVAGDHAPSASDAVTARVGPTAVHDQLAAADLCVTDLGTLATESALLGTPTVYAGENPPRRVQHLANMYQLVQFADDESLSTVALARLGDESAATLWRRRQRLLVEESVDVTEFVADRILSEAT